MTYSAAVPDLLRAIRANLDLTQVELAERLGVSFATVNRWEGGDSRTSRRKQRWLASSPWPKKQVPMSAMQLVPFPPSGPLGGGAPLRPTTTKPMEQMLWDAACSIRGEKDAPKFKDYLLPLLFLKRLSDVFDDEIDRLAEDYGDRATALEIVEGDHSLLRFYVPQEARWAVLSGREAYTLAERGGEAPKDIGEHLTKAVRAVVKQNPGLPV